MCVYVGTLAVFVVELYLIISIGGTLAYNLYGGTLAYNLYGGTLAYNLFGGTLANPMEEL